MSLVLFSAVETWSNYCIPLFALLLLRGATFISIGTERAKGMAQPPVTQVKSEIYRDLIVNAGRIVHHPNRWQPFLEISLAVQTKRFVPILISGSDLYLSYEEEEVGPLPPLSISYLLREPGNSIQITMRKDLYPALEEDLKYHHFSRREFQIRGYLAVEAPGYDGRLEIPIDATYRLQL